MHSYLKDNLYSYLQEGQDVGHVLQGCGQQFVCGQQGVGQGALHLGSHVGHTGVYPPQEGWQQDDGPQDGAQEEPQLDPHGPQEGPQLEPQQRQRKWKQLLACKPDDKYEHPQDVAGMEDAKKHMVLNFLALLVQKYIY